MSGDSDSLDVIGKDFQRFRQSSAANIFAMDQRHEHLDEFRDRRSSFSSFLKLRSNNLQNKPLTRQVISDFPEDCDKWSLISDSCVSEVSTTDASVTSVLSTGVVPHSPPMRRNFSSNDVTLLKHHNIKPSLELKAQQKVQNFMLLNWLSNQKQCIPENHQLENPMVKLEVNQSSTAPQEKKVKSRYSMRDLNAVVPNGW